MGGHSGERGEPCGATGARAEGVTPAERALWLALRQALLISLAAIEVYLGLERSAPPRRVRRGRLARQGITPGLTVHGRTVGPGIEVSDD